MGHSTVGNVGVTSNEFYVPSIAPKSGLALAPLIVVLGPTGAGKSELALHIAQAVGGEIVNCDSVQVYRGLEIGSAKLSLQERRGIPHHLLDIVGPHEELTAGAYAALARATLQGVAERGNVAVVVGGTGFYLRALLAGLSPAPPRDARLRVRLSALASRRPAALHRFLRRHDPASALRIHGNDHQKLMRAIELTWLSKQPASRVQSAPRQPLHGFRVLKLGLTPARNSLREALDTRSTEIFRRGIVEETRALLASGLDPRAKSLETLGYKQAVEFITGEISLADAVRQCQIRTRQYAKRQMTWFRAEPDVEWLAGFGGDPAVQEKALGLAREFLI